LSLSQGIELPSIYSPILEHIPQCVIEHIRGFSETSVILSGLVCHWIRFCQGIVRRRSLSLASSKVSRQKVHDSDKFVTFVDLAIEYEGTNALSTEMTSNSFCVEAKEWGEEPLFDTFEVECVSAWLQY
jgi:hypothetical protein